MASAVRLVVRGVRDLFHHPWPQVFTLAAVTLAAFLAGLFLLLLHNLDQELIRHSGRVQFQIYWQEDADKSVYVQQWSELMDDPALAEIATYTPKQAVGDLLASFGREADAVWFKSGVPLPPTALATFSVPVDAPENWSRAVFDRLKGLEGVHEVHYNPMQMDLARSWVSVGRKIIWPLIGVLAVVAGLIVGNTIKLAQISRRDEVEILRLVGASQFYIELPLLAGGAVICLAGAALGLSLLKLFQFTVKDVLNTPPLLVTIDYVPLELAAGLAGAMALVGLVSSWVAVKN